MFKPLTVQLSIINQKCIQQQGGGEGSELMCYQNGLLCSASPTCYSEQWYFTLDSMFVDDHLCQQLCSHLELIQDDTGLTLQPSTVQGLKPTFFIAHPR